MKTVSTPKAPRAIGPYSQAVVAGGFVFCSGQIPLDPATGELVVGGIKKQTECVFKNLEAVLKAAGARPGLVISVTVYLKDLKDFKGMNEVYAAKFGKRKPARATIGISELPKNALVEISCVAYIKK